MSGAYVFPVASGTATPPPAAQHDLSVNDIVNPGETYWHNDRLYTNATNAPVNVGDPISVAQLEDVTADRTGAEKWFTTEVAMKADTSFVAGDVDNLYGTRQPRTQLWRLVSTAPNVFENLDPPASSVSDTVVIANVPADTWTAATSTIVTNVIDFNVFGVGQVLQRIVAGRAEIRSSVALTNVTLNLQG